MVKAWTLGFLVDCVLVPDIKGRTSKGGTREEGADEGNWT